MKFSVTGKWHSDRHGYRGQEREGYGSLGNAYQSLGDYRKALEYHEKHLKIATEIGDQAGVRAAYYNHGIQFIFVEEIENAVDNFVSAVDALNSLRSLQNWKINFRELHEKTYTAVWMSLLRIKRLMKLCLGLNKDERRLCLTTCCFNINLSIYTSLSSAKNNITETIFRLFTKPSLPTLFLAIEGCTTNI